MSVNSQLDDELINFVAEKVKNVTSPMKLSELCRKFKKKSGTSSSDNKLLHRLQSIRDKMSEMENFDNETKVTMMFALGSPVSSGLLIELKKEADIDLDEQHRITKYKKFGQGLKLSGVHTGAGRSCDIDVERRMLKFLAEKSENATSPMTDIAFLREFNLLEGNFKSDDNFQKRYNLFKQQIYLAPEYDQETKIKMMFVSNTKVHANILEKLRKNAVVEVDKYQRITKYKANDGSLVLEGESKKYGVQPNKEWSKEDEYKLLSFIAEKSKQTKVPLTVRQLIKKYANKNGISRTTGAVKCHLRKHVLPKISKLHNFDIETRMRMLFALGAPVDEDFLNKLREKALVKIDKKRRITKYEAKDGSLELTRDCSISTKTGAKRGTKKSVSRSSEVSGNDEETEGEEGVDNNMNDEEEDVEEEVSRSNTRNGRLSNKRLPDNPFFSDSDDNSCESSDKVKRSKNRKTEKVTRKTRTTYFSETDDETEDEESEVEYEEEEEVESNSSTRKSGRISNQRYPDVDFSCDFGDVSFDSPRKVEGSKTIKETEKLVVNSPNSSPKTPIVKNKKRKIVERPSDATSSSLKYRKFGRDVGIQNDTQSENTVNQAKQNDEIGRVAYTQNSTETDTVASGTMQNNDKEVVYDGSGEPPRPIKLTIKQESSSHEKVKLEDEEYKPDRSFLSGTSQNNMQNCSVAEEIRSDDLDQSSENTEEMTSGKEFMKSLGCLVDTLDSPILNKLLVKVEKAIEEIGDGDHKIPTDEIAMTLNSGLVILNKNATIKPPTGESTSLRDFFLILRSTLSIFRSSSLNNFQFKLKKNIKELNGQDKFILLESIRTVLEPVLLLVSP